MKNTTTLWCIGLSLLACEPARPLPSPEPPSSPPPGAAPSPSASASPTPATAPLETARVEAATGLKAEVSDNVVRVAYPRSDVKVEVDGFAMPPFMGLTSWAGFTRGDEPGVEAMAMGDLVLFEDEVSDAMSAALNGGLSVTALHNHFFYDKPHVFFMHIEGEGSLDAVGKGVKATLDAVKAVRARQAQPASRFEGAAMPALASKSAIEAAKIEGVFGVKGAAKDGMVKVTLGRAATTAACGCKIGKAMGVNTWAAFAGTEENALVDGDFAVSEDELQPVLKSLRGSGIHVVAIHHHLVGEQPRILFLHYWGRGPAGTLAANVKKAVDLTKTRD